MNANGVEGIVLAAGLSSRMGRNKAALMIGGKPLLAWAVEGMGGVCGRVIVVGGKYFEDVRRICRNYGNTEVVFNAGYRNGMFGSVREGARRVRAERFFILPGDCPFIGRGVYEAMLKADGDIVVPAYEGVRGHPVLLKRALVREILEAPCRETLRGLIERHGFTTLDLRDRGILTDIDTEDDYRNAVEWMERREDGAR
jgi:molybdenum cofactor cytidylyltransferase